MKLTKAQIKVLIAYRDRTTHNSPERVTSSLLESGLLEPHFDGNKWLLRISEKGLLAVGNK